MRSERAVSLMIYNSLSVWLLNHCFMTCTTCTSHTSWKIPLTTHISSCILDMDAIYRIFCLTSLFIFIQIKTIFRWTICLEKWYHFYTSLAHKSLETQDHYLKQNQNAFTTLYTISLLHQLLEGELVIQNNNYYCWIRFLWYSEW